MIISNRDGVTIEGRLIDLMAEYSAITHSFLEVLEDASDSREEAIEQLNECFSVGKKSIKELKADNKKKIRNLIKEHGEDVLEKLLDGLLDILNEGGEDNE